MLPDEFINFPLDILIFKDTILLVDYEAERLVYIEDSAISKTYKALFRIAEAQGTKINLNQRLKEVLRHL